MEYLRSPARISSSLCSLQPILPQGIVALLASLLFPSIINIVTQYKNRVYSLCRSPGSSSPMASRPGCAGKHLLVPVPVKNARILGRRFPLTCINAYPPKRLDPSHSIHITPCTGTAIQPSLGEPLPRPRFYSVVVERERESFSSSCRLLELPSASYH